MYRSMTISMAVLLAASWAAADTDLPIEVNYRSALVAGKDRPCIKLTAESDLRRLMVAVSRVGKVVRKKIRAMSSGQNLDICWKERPGIYTYRVGLSSRLVGKMVRKELTIKINLLPPIKLVLPKNKIDLDRRRLMFFLNHPTDRAELSISGKGGKVLLETSREYSGAMPGKALELTWGPVRGDLARLDLKVYSTGGFWTGMAITPWAVQIPHEEVAFATNRWDIRREEAPKLDAAIKEIRKALRSHGSQLLVKLFVGGFTDTVGSASHNRTLSTSRARSIARYFRKKGIKIPILYRGYGEEALAVGTRDETAEARNRRALYVLATQPPVLSKQVKWGKWRAVK